MKSANWIRARKNGKKFIEARDKLPTPPNPNPPAVKYAQSTDHKIKAFADDMSVITASKSDHQKALTDIDTACCDLGLRLKPAKCISIVLENGKVQKDSFQLATGNTRSITAGPTKFLGQTLAATESLTKKSANIKLKVTINEGLKQIDDRPIRGEMKVWLLCNHLIPSAHFQLNGIEDSIKTMYQKVNHQQPKKSLINATKRLVKEKEKENWDGNYKPYKYRESLLKQLHLRKRPDCGAKSWMDYPKDSSLFS